MIVCLHTYSSICPHLTQARLDRISVNLSKMKELGLLGFNVDLKEKRQNKRQRHQGGNSGAGNTKLSSGSGIGGDGDCDDGIGGGGKRRQSLRGLATQQVM